MSCLSSRGKQLLIRIIKKFLRSSVSGSSAVVYAYVGEFHDNIYRPKVVSWLATFVAFGNMIIPGFAWLLLPLDIQYEIPFIGIVFRSWRLLVLTYGSPSVIAATCIYMLPESPKYLLTQGLKDDALNIMKKMYKINTGKDEDTFPVSDITLNEISAGIDKKKEGIFKSMWKQTVPLFKPPFALKTFLVCVLQFGTFAS